MSIVDHNKNSNKKNFYDSIAFQVDLLNKNGMKILQSESSHKQLICVWFQI